VKIVSVQEMREIERIADLNGCSYTTMLENAGTNLGKWVNRQFSCLKNHFAIGLVGSGNNGGDTLVALDYLAKNGWFSVAYLVKPRSQDDIYLKRLLESGGHVISVENDLEFIKFKGLISHKAVILDGILGTGFIKPMESHLFLCMKSISSTISEHRNNLHVIAVDTPSGVDCDLGTVSDYVINADYTACMEAVKAGLIKFPANDFVGEIIRIEIGLPPQNSILDNKEFELIGAGYVKSNLPKRPNDSHKGSFGTSLIYAGSESYVGATYLSAKAAYYSGAGLVHVLTKRFVLAALSGALVEVIWTTIDHLDQATLEIAILKASSMLIGPGIDLSKNSCLLFERLLVTIKKIKPTMPVIIDADGLRHLSRIKNWHEMFSPLDIILTPHPGELAILTGKSIKEIQSDRILTATYFAKKWQKTVCLKGANTVIAFSDGHAVVSNAATAALATAGTGDILAGLISGYCAQGVNSEIAAVVATYIHAEAGKLSGRIKGQNASVIASDVLEAIPLVLAELNTGN